MPNTPPGDAPRAFPPTPRTTLKRRAARGRHEVASVVGIIDEALYCHVSFVLDDEPHVLPTAHARVGDVLYLHGATANRMFRVLASGGRCSITFTLLDGLVFARSAFHHSMNYRSAVVFGQPEEVLDEEEKRRALRAVVDHAAAGRSTEVPEPRAEELARTRVLRVALQEAVAKVRSGPAVDDPQELRDARCWAGVLPLRTRAGAMERDAQLPFDRGPSLAVARCAARFEADAPVEQCDGGVLLSTDRARLDVPLVHAYLRDESYWAAGVSLPRMQRVIARSLCFGGYRDGAQLAFARVVDDGGRFAYLADVFVVPAERGRGLGKRLLDFVFAHPALQDVDRILLGTRDAHELYRRYGFDEAPAGRYMLRARA